MADVTFDEEKDLLPASASAAPRQSSNIFIRLGIAKTEAQANIIAIVIAVSALLLAVLLYVRANPPRPAPTPAEIEEFHQMKQLGEPQP